MSDPLWTKDRNYIIVVDAGSSGSRSQIYSWIDNEIAAKALERAGNSTAILPEIERATPSGENSQYKVEPGISKYDKDINGISQYLSPLISHAKSVIPSSEWSKTPVFLLATAGMRLVDGNVREKMLKNVCQTFERESPFLLTSCEQNVQVISGELEGIYGWTAVNYLLGGFTEEEVNVIPHDESQSVQSTLGFLDMGGASTQIAFEPTQEQSRLHANDLTPVRLRLLNGKEVDHQVFSSTWLGYGTEQARLRYTEHLVSNTTPTADHLIMDPCLPKGLQRAEGGPGKPALVGSGSWKKCLELTEPLLNIDAPCTDEPCLFNGQHVPEIDFTAEHFVGISEYWYSSQDVFGLGDAYNYATFAQKADEFCGRDWQDIDNDFQSKGIYSSQVSLGRLEMQCFKAAWIANVLHVGIKLPKVVKKPNIDDSKIIAETATEDRPTFRSVDQIKGMSLSWALGKVVQEASMQGRSFSSARGAKYPFLHDGVIGRPGSGIVFALALFFGLVLYIFRRYLTYQGKNLYRTEQYEMTAAEEGAYTASRNGTMPSRKSWLGRLYYILMPRSRPHQNRAYRPSFARNSASTPAIPLSIKNTRRSNGVNITRSESSDVLSRQTSPFLRSSTPPRK